MNVLTNARTYLNSSSGGAVRVFISSNVAQGNGGTSIPCREVYLAGGMTSLGDSNAEMVRVNIGVAATSVLGIAVPTVTNVSAGVIISITTVIPAPMRLPIDDVNELYFWGASDTDSVDILYRK